jgi:hypothetical protein
MYSIRISLVTIVQNLTDNELQTIIFQNFEVEVLLPMNSGRRTGSAFTYLIV